MIEKKENTFSVLSKQNHHDSYILKQNLSLKFVTFLSIGKPRSGNDQVKKIYSATYQMILKKTFKM